MQRRQFISVAGVSLVGGIGLSAGASAGESVCAGQRFEVFRDAIDEWRWNLFAANGQVIATSEGYKQRANCLHSIDLIRSSEHTPTSFKSDCEN